ncbi:MAG: type III-A CRISPR-associated protein Csm2 [Chloroflexota bacterium]|nr:type III-A CRISPR-associated protein Csm2 [Ardenticatenaceae bacterium]
MAGNDQQSVDLGISKQTLRDIIITGNAQTLVEHAKSIGDKLGKTLTTNQIRAIFGTVRQIEMDWDDVAGQARQERAQRQLILLQPKMAYRASKEGRGGRGLQALTNVLSDSIDLVMDDKVPPAEKRERFGRFVDFFEAILAYHTVAGGR